MASYNSAPSLFSAGLPISVFVPCPPVLPRFLCGQSADTARPLAEDLPGDFIHLCTVAPPPAVRYPAKRERHESAGRVPPGSPGRWSVVLWKTRRTAVRPNQSPPKLLRRWSKIKTNTQTEAYNVNRLINANYACLLLSNLRRVLVC